RAAALARSRHRDVVSGDRPPPDQEPPDLVVARHRRDPRMSETVLPMLIVEDGAAGTLLRAPKLGLWSDHPKDGAYVEAGAPAGRLVQLKRSFRLVIPDGVAGRVAIAPQATASVPVAY